MMGGRVRKHSSNQATGFRIKLAGNQPQTLACNARCHQALYCKMDSYLKQYCQNEFHNSHSCRTYFLLFTTHMDGLERRQPKTDDEPGRSLVKNNIDRE